MHGNSLAPFVTLSYPSPFPSVTYHSHIIPSPLATRSLPLPYGLCEARGNKTRNELAYGPYRIVPSFISEQSEVQMPLWSVSLISYSQLSHSFHNGICTAHSIILLSPCLVSSRLPWLTPGPDRRG